MPDVETVVPQTISESARAALAEQSGKADQAKDAGSEAVTEVADETKTESTETQQSQDTEKAQGATDESAEDEQESPLTEADLKSLSPEDRKRVNKILTPKFQEYKASQKKYERLSQYAEFLDALETSPQDTWTKFGRQFGWLPGDEKKADPGAAGNGNGDTTAPQAASETVAALKAKLPEELHALADAFAPAIEELIEKKTSGLRKDLEPIQQRMHQSEIESIKAKTDSELAAFETAHPGWKKHEKKMMEIAKVILPANDKVTTEQYLGHLLKLATYDIQVGDEVKKTIDRQKKAAGDSETRSSTVPAKKVSPGPAGPLSVREAAAMAIRGELVSQD